MLLTDIKFRLDKDGNIAESEQPIDQALIDQAMNMDKAEFERQNEARRKREEVKLLNGNLSLRCAYAAYKQAGGADDFAKFVGGVLDQVEAELA